jgi:hypothetical protein
MFVYVTGPLEAASEIARERNLEQLDLVNRRILTTRNVPICPCKFYEGYNADNRLLADPYWWVYNVYRPLMQMCTHFCIITSRMDHGNPRIRAEKELWQEIGNGKFIVEANIMNYLLGLGDV